MSQVTTHILDTTKGKPAMGVVVTLYQQQNSHWSEIARSITNADGRIADLLGKEVVLMPGIYKMKFDIKAYFDHQSTRAFYPFVEIAFQITGNEHYHVPLLLNPFGYTTYRGS